VLVASCWLLVLVIGYWFWLLAAGCWSLVAGVDVDPSTWRPALCVSPVQSGALGQGPCRESWTLRHGSSSTQSASRRLPQDYWTSTQEGPCVPIKLKFLVEKRRVRTSTATGRPLDSVDMDRAVLQSAPGTPRLALPKSRQPLISSKTRLHAFRLICCLALLRVAGHSWELGRFCLEDHQLKCLSCDWSREGALPDCALAAWHTAHTIGPGQRPPQSVAFYSVQYSSNLL
jgi:hypothetical protein